MTLSEKVSYLKGLADGLVLDENNKQDKLIRAIIELLEDVALSVEEVECGCGEICDQIDAIDEDLATLEDDFYGDEECDGDCDGCSCDCDADEDDCEYEVECPKCHDLIYLTGEMLDEGEIMCPNCNTKLEFEFDCDDEGSEDNTEED